MEHVITKLYEYAGNNEVDLALGQLQRVFSLSNSELLSDTILLSAQFKKLQSDSRKGILDHAQENLGHSRIVHSILGLIREIKDNPSRFSGYERAEKELDQSVEERSSTRLSAESKDALFDRLMYFQSKSLKVQALWVDDSTPSTSYEHQALEAMGLQIDQAASSEEAQRMIRNKSYELILSDMNRNGIPDEGLRFHRALMEQGMDIPLIFYVGRVDRSKGVPPFAFGIADLPNELMHLVMDVLSRKY